MHDNPSGNAQPHPEPFWKLLGTLYKAHPWHGVSPGEKVPAELLCCVEVVPSDTVKYEMDKLTGYLRLDRPQKYSNLCPALYGFVPQTFCGTRGITECTWYSKLKGAARGNGFHWIMRLRPLRWCRASRPARHSHVEREAGISDHSMVIVGIAAHDGDLQFQRATPL